MPDSYRSPLSPLALGAHDRQKDFSNGLWDRVLDQVALLLPKDALVIDAGVGSGLVAQRLASLGLNVVGFDFNESMLAALAARTSGSLPYGLADVCALPLRAASAHGVVMTNVVHLLRDWRSAVTEAARVLRPSGALFVGLGNGGTSEVAAVINTHFRSLVPTAPAEAFGPASEAEFLEALMDGDLVVGEPLVAREELRRTVGSTIERLQHNVFTWPPEVPQQVLDAAAEDSRGWAKARFGSLEFEYDVHVEFRLVVAHQA